MAGADYRCFLALPNYGGYHGHCAEAVLYATGGRGAVKPSYRSDSFLCRNFNALWCEALNGREEHGWTHFAMIHQDVRPHAYGWLDDMVDRLRRSGAGLLSVVLPIKDGLGTTSTAVAGADGRVKKLSVKEVAGLPELIDGAAVGPMLDGGAPPYRVLGATGLWVCDFTKPWAERAYFEVRDRVVKRAGGPCECGHARPDHCREFHDHPTTCRGCTCEQYVGTRKVFDAETEPDDWPFMARLHRLGVEVIAAKMPCGHYGTNEWVPWAEEPRAVESCPWFGPVEWAKP